LTGKKTLLESIHSEISLMAAHQTDGPSHHRYQHPECAPAQIRHPGPDQHGTENLGLMKINVMSFGYKYGIPPDADLVIDLRFLANPYFDPQLKNLDGESEAVRQFVLSNPETGIFLEKYLNLLDYLIPLYKRENKAYLTIAVGCTGGRHEALSSHAVSLSTLTRKNVIPDSYTGTLTGI
jgi:RNase adapter protein RapZ